MANFGIKPSVPESIELIQNSFVEVGDAYNLAPNVIDQLQSEIVDQYSQAGRHHHAVPHLGELVIFANTFGDRPDMGERFDGAKIDRMAVLLMDLYHDYHLDVGVRDAENVARSANLAYQKLHWAGLPTSDVGKVFGGIRASATHELVSDVSIAFFSDGDMSVLGMPAGRYNEYDMDVEQEYTRIYTPEQYNQGRVELFLKPFINKPQIFNTDFAVKLLDNQAKSNMQRELDKREKH